MPADTAPAAAPRLLSGKGARKPFPVWAMLGVALAVTFVTLLPGVRLLVTALAPGGELDLAAFIERLTTTSAMRATWRTLDTAFFGAILSMMIGAPFAIAVAMTNMPAARIMGFVLLLPLMIAPQVTALAWLNLAGPSSALLGLLGIAPPPGTPNPVLGRGGIILLYGVQHAPLVFVTMRAGLASIPRDLVEAARASGASQKRVIFDVVLPLIRPYIV
ncbi:MAG: ABC transporter permease subunit, partial [Mesorhizobium sp.]